MDARSMPPERALLGDLGLERPERDGALAEELLEEVLGAEGLALELGVVLLHGQDLAIADVWLRPFAGVEHDLVPAALGFDLGHEALGHERVDDLLLGVGTLVDRDVHLEIEDVLEEELELVEPAPQVIIAVAALH